MQRLEEMALRLWEAGKRKEGLPPLTDDSPNLTPEEAYEIQLINIRRRIDLGERVVGKKIGLTSKAMQEMLQVTEPDYGHLLNTMAIEAGEKVPWEPLFQPKVEGELAFILKERIKGPQVTVPDVIRAVEWVLPSIEIVDSRIRDWKIKLPDTIADNASSGLFLLGRERLPLKDMDVTEIGMNLYVNGTLVNTGVGAAALGNPLFSVAWLANFLSRFDIALEAGEVVLSGALSAAVPAKPGDHVEVRFAEMEPLSLQF